MILHNNFLFDYNRNACNQSGFSNVTYATASLPRQLPTTKLPKMHFAVTGLVNIKLWLWLVGTAMSLTYWIKMNVERGNV